MPLDQPPVIFQSDIWTTGIGSTLARSSINFVVTGNMILEITGDGCKAGVKIYPASKRDLNRALHILENSNACEWADFKAKTLISK